MMKSLNFWAGRKSIHPLASTLPPTFAVEAEIFEPGSPGGHPDGNFRLPFLLAKGRTGPAHHPQNWTPFLNTLAQKFKPRTDNVGEIYNTINGAKQ